LFWPEGRWAQKKFGAGQQTVGFPSRRIAMTEASAQTAARPVFYAHSSGAAGKPEPLSDHLLAVAKRAFRFASAYNAAEEAGIAGLLHDLGKYGEVFQRRLQGLETGVDHWWAGAWAALTRYQRYGVGICLAIQGHHLGLQRCHSDDFHLQLDPVRIRADHPLRLRLSEPNGDLDLLVRRLEQDGIDLPQLSRSLCEVFARDCDAAFMLDVRILFSALVDADYLETECHFEGHPREDAPPLEPHRLLRVLGDYIAEITRSSHASEELNAVRAELRDACIAAAELPPGLFTLTAPTGSGKTLSLLDFALRHAHRYGLRRVVTVIPYLSIIDQTVHVYRQALDLEIGSPVLIEDHSLAIAQGRDGRNEVHDRGPGDEAARIQQQAAENWDAPLIVTTSVQMLESLFANRPAACRKLHRLAGSVILFDEVQTLPVRIAVPTLAALSRLAERYCCTIVFSTATQPAFAHLDQAVRKFCPVGWEPREIVPQPEGLFARTHRTRVHWPENSRVLSWAALADRVAALPEPRLVLVVLNLKRHALELFQRLQAREISGLFHLSTSMCPEHRKAVLAEISRRLLGDSTEPCMLVATQCVEAGVDLDFPLVMRALGPLDGVAQAAGRCNRNAGLSQAVVEVFVPNDERLYPDKAYRQAASITELLLKRHGDALDIHSPRYFEEYYRELYDLSEAANQGPELQAAIRDRNFAVVAYLYRVIEKDAVNVLVPYDDGVFMTLSREVRNDGLTRDWIRRARPHAVSIFRPRAATPEEGYLEPVPVRRGQFASDWFLLADRKHYQPETGLQLPKAAEVLMI
jgi:CRISPR-associated helicase Cas3/CRISPR-associated endonuclease Cas3-HD